MKTGKNQAGSPAADYFFLNADYSQVKIMFDDIRWMEGVRDYVKIHLKSSTRPLMFRTSLKALEPELPALKFIRIHKSFIVAIESITSVRKTGLSIKDMELPIGETYRNAVEQLIRKKI